MGVSANYRMREVTIPADLATVNSQAVLDALEAFLITAPLNWTTEAITTDLAVDSGVAKLAMSSVGESGTDFLFFRIELNVSGLRIKTGLHYARTGAVETITDDTGFEHNLGFNALGNPVSALDLSQALRLRMYADRDFAVFFLNADGSPNSRGYMVYAGRLDSMYQGSMTTLSAPALAGATSLSVVDETPFDTVGYPSKYFIAHKIQGGKLEKIEVTSSAPGVLNLAAPLSNPFASGAEVGEDLHPIYVGIPDQILESGFQKMANDLKVGYTVVQPSRKDVVSASLVEKAINTRRDRFRWPIWPTVIEQGSLVNAFDYRGQFKGMWAVIGSAAFSPNVGNPSTFPDPADYDGRTYDLMLPVYDPISGYIIEQGTVI